MKITKTDSDTQKLQRSVYEKIADRYGKDIPLMKSLSGDSDGRAIHINFRTHARIAAQAEQIATKSDMVNNKSEIHRAAHYFGICVFYHLLMRSDYGFKHSSVYENLLECEDLDYDYQILDDATRTFKKVFNAYRSNIIDTEQANLRTQNIVDALPKNLRELARQKANLVFEGKKLSEILNERTPGRPFLITEK